MPHPVSSLLGFSTPAYVTRAVAAAGLLGLLGPVHALDVSGVAFPERTELAAGGAQLVLNGAGLFSRAFFHVYVVGLYLPGRQGTLRDILADKGPKRISLTMLREVRSQQFAEHLIEGLADNHTVSELESLKTPVDELLLVIGQLKVAKKGDVITLDYLPGSGTRVSLNGASRGKPIPGDDLYPALLRIWLGDDPVDRRLRRALLGE